MKDLFVCLLLNLKNHWNITQTSMYDSGFAKITLVDGDDTYDVSVMKREKVEVDENA